MVKNKLLQFAGRGEEGYAVHSPAMVGSIFLTFKQGSYSKLEYMERGGEVVTLKLLDKHSLKHSVELMAHQHFGRMSLSLLFSQGRSISLSLRLLA